MSSTRKTRKHIGTNKSLASSLKCNGYRKWTYVILNGVSIYYKWDLEKIISYKLIPSDQFEWESMFCSTGYKQRRPTPPERPTGQYLIFTSDGCEMNWWQVGPVGLVQDFIHDNTIYWSVIHNLKAELQLRTIRASEERTKTNCTVSNLGLPYNYKSSDCNGFGNRAKDIEILKLNNRGCNCEDCSLLRKAW